VDVLFGIEAVDDAVGRRRPRHELHEPAGACAADRVGIALGLDFDDRRQERRRDARLLRLSPNQALELRGG
jgi:hypothetical protein